MKQKHQKAKSELAMVWIIATILFYSHTVFGQERWTWQNPLPIGTTINDVCWNGSMFAAVCDAGIVLLSRDGIAWESFSTDCQNNLKAIIWTGNFFLTVGASGNTGTSTDGRSWSWHNCGSYVTLSDVAWTGSLAIAVPDYSSTSYASVDGSNWRAVDQLTMGLTSIVYARDRLVEVGAGGLVVTSSDGLNWDTSIVGTTRELNAVAYTGTHTVTVGARGTVAYSRDGTEWEIFTTDTNVFLTGVVGSADSIVAVGYEYFQGPKIGSPGHGVVITAKLGVGWTRSSMPGLKRLQSVTKGQPTTVAVGNDGIIVTPGDSMLWREQSRAVTRSPITGIAQTGTLLVGVTYNGQILTSQNGEQWAICYEPTGNTNVLKSVAWSGTRFVATGETTLTSDDGTHWTVTVEDMGFDYMNGITWSGSRFVAVGGTGIVLTSTDGSRWQRQVSGVDQFLFAVTWTGNRLVAVGDEALVLTSQDGVAWTVRNREVSSIVRLQNVAAKGDTVIATGSFMTRGYLYFSADGGVTWQLRNIGVDLYRLAGVTSGFLAASPGLDKAVLYQSTDGLNWKSTRLPTTVCPDVLLQSGAKWLVAGNGGMILTCDTASCDLGVYRRSSPQAARNRSHFITENGQGGAGFVFFDLLGRSFSGMPNGSQGGLQQTRGCGFLLVSPQQHKTPSKPGVSVKIRK